MSTSQAVIAYCNWLCCMVFENKAILEGNIKGSINKKLSSHIADLDIKGVGGGDFHDGSVKKNVR